MPHADVNGQRLRDALASPDRVRGLVLIDTSSDVDDPETLGGYEQIEAGWTSPDTPDDVRAGLHDMVAGLIVGDPEAANPAILEFLPQPVSERSERTMSPRIEGSLVPRECGRGDAVASSMAHQ